ncbi:MAG: SDR family NAD(P)-dependent oxidoreductase [Faecalibacillus sp.]
MKKYTIVTGASSGIGMAIAKMFAKREKNLIIIARRTERLKQLQNELINDHPQLDVIIKTCDLSDIEQVYQLYEDLKQYDIEIWINNAGFGHSKRVLEQDLKRVSQMIRLNLEAVTILSTLYARDYQDKDATLINVSSTVGYGVSSRVPSYSATKFYVSAFTEALYWEMKDANKKLRVKVLAPAATLSEFSMVSAGLDKPIDVSHFVGNSVEEMANFLGQLYDSDECLGYIETDDYTFHLSKPRIPHSFTKMTNPNLLK